MTADDREAIAQMAGAQMMALGLVSRALARGGALDLFELELMARVGIQHAEHHAARDLLEVFATMLGDGQRPPPKRRGRLRVVAPLVAAMMVAGGARADYLFSGNVTSTTVPSVYVGDTAHLTVTFDDESTTPNASGEYTSNGAILTIERPPIDPLDYVCLVGVVDVTNYLWDTFSALATQCVAFPSGIARPTALVGIELDDPFGDALDSTALPSSFDLDAFTTRRIALADGPLLIYAEVRDVLVIPEPDTLASALAALGPLLGLRRRHAALFSGSPPVPASAGSPFPGGFRGSSGGKWSLG